MSLELKNNIQLAANAISFKIYDTSTGWDTDGDPASGAILKAYLAIITDRYEPVFYDLMIDTRWTEYLSTEGLEIPIGNIYPELGGFPDDSYDMYLIINSTGNEIVIDGVIIDGDVEFDYHNYQGFLAYIREAARKLPLPLDFDKFDSQENKHIYQLHMLLEGAESDANQGKSERFNEKIDYVSDQLNLRGIEYVR